MNNDQAFPGTDDVRTSEQVSDYIKTQNAKWPAGYCLDPNGNMVCPEGQREAWVFGYDIGYQDAFKTLKSAQLKVMIEADAVELESALRGVLEVFDSNDTDIRLGAMANAKAVLAQLDAPQPAKPVIPDGMVLVPIEPPIHAVARLPGTETEARRTYSRVIAAASGGLVAYSCQNECEGCLLCGDWCGNQESCLAVFKAAELLEALAAPQPAAPQAEPCEKCYQDGFLAGQQYGRGATPAPAQAVPLTELLDKRESDSYSCGLLVRDIRAALGITAPQGEQQ